MTWTAEAPTITGWYWWRDRDHEPRPILVSDYGDRERLMIHVSITRYRETLMRPSEIGGEWLGPITPEDSTASAEQLRAGLKLLCESILTCSRENTDEWMEYIVGQVNQMAELLGEDDRFVWRINGCNGWGRVERAGQ